MDDDETEQEGADTISSQTMNTSETPHPTPSGHLRGTLPAWLGDKYADACEQLTQEIKVKGRPKCYEDGGFVMQTPPLIFVVPSHTRSDPSISIGQSFSSGYPIYSTVSLVPLSKRLADALK